MHNFADHLRTHTREKPYRCLDVHKTGCEKRFASKTNLNKHLKVCYQKTYQCNVCFKTYRRPSYLIKHQRTHTKRELSQALKKACSSSKKGKKTLVAMKGSKSQVSKTCNYRQNTEKDN
mmetsp:Transcript_49000/g.66717  ORF Transcript_49000/g.66717 Transcript_49000/m.66717 type:complete len:119 (+) Transcript_49000:1036-1392(+)